MILLATSTSPAFCAIRRGFDCLSRCGVSDNEDLPTDPDSLVAKPQTPLTAARFYGAVDSVALSTPDVLTRVWYWECPPRSGSYSASMRGIGPGTIARHPEHSGRRGSVSATREPL